MHLSRCRNNHPTPSRCTQHIQRRSYLDLLNKKNRSDAVAPGRNPTPTVLASHTHTLPLARASINGLSGALGALTHQHHSELTKQACHSPLRSSEDVWRRRHRERPDGGAPGRPPQGLRRPHAQERARLQRLRRHRHGRRHRAPRPRRHLPAHQLHHRRPQQRGTREGGRGGEPGAVAPADEPAVHHHRREQVRRHLRLVGGQAGGAGRHHRQEQPRRRILPQDHHPRQRARPRHRRLRRQLMGLPAGQVPLQPRLLRQRHVPAAPDAGGAQAVPRRRAPEPEGRRPAGAIPGPRPRLPLRRLQRPRRHPRRPRRLQGPPLPAPLPHRPEALGWQARPREPAAAAGAERLRAARRALRPSQAVRLPGLHAQGAGGRHRAGHPHLRRPLTRRVRLLRRHPQALRGRHQAAQHPGPRGGAQALPAPARQGPHPHGRRLPPQTPQAANHQSGRESMDDRRGVRQGDARRRQPHDDQTPHGVPSQEHSGSEQVRRPHEHHHRGARGEEPRGPHCAAGAQQQQALHRGPARQPDAVPGQHQQPRRQLRVRDQDPPLPARGRHARAGRHRTELAADPGRPHHRQEHRVHAAARRRRGLDMAARQGLRLRERLRLAPAHQPLAQHARRHGALRHRDQQAAQRHPPGVQAPAPALPRHHEHQRKGPGSAHQRRRRHRDDRVPAQARHAHVLHGLQALELHRTSSARRSNQEGHGGGGPIEPAQGAAADQGLPVRGGRAGRVGRDRGVGGRLPNHLLPQRRRAAGRRGAAGVVEGGAGGGARRPQGRGVVAQDADGGGADQGLRHHHLDRVGAPRGRQLRAVPLLGLPPQQAVGEPEADAGGGQRGVRGAGARPGEGLHPHHHQPVPGPGGHLAHGDPVQALLRRGVPGAARHAGVDVGRQGAGGVQAVRGEAGGHREAGGGHERGPAAQEPHRAGQVPLHAALPQHLRPHGQAEGLTARGIPNSISI